MPRLAISDIPADVGRRTINDEQMPARVPEGTKARIRAVLGERESQADFIREAIEREIKRRSRTPSPKP